MTERKQVKHMCEKGKLLLPHRSRSAVLIVQSKGFLLGAAQEFFVSSSAITHTAADAL
jgi:hypothetical protein